VIIQLSPTTGSTGLRGLFAISVICGEVHRNKVFAPECSEDSRPADKAGHYWSFAKRSTDRHEREATSFSRRCPAALTGGTTTPRIQPQPEAKTARSRAEFGPILRDRRISTAPPRYQNCGDDDRCNPENKRRELEHASQSWDYHGHLSSAFSIAVVCWMRPVRPPRRAAGRMAAHGLRRP